MLLAFTSLIQEMSSRSMKDGESSGIPHPARYGLSWLMTPITFALIIGVWLADLRNVHPSPLILTALNFLFATAVLLLIAYLVGRSFLTSGEPGLLLLGCGVVVWGLASVVAAANTYGDINLTPTITGLSGWLCATLHLTGVILSIRSHYSLKPVGVWLLLGYGFAVACVILVTVAAWAGWLPTFFEQGRGGTPIRFATLGSAITMFFLTSVLLVTASREPISRFAYYYAAALSLIATGFFGVMIQVSVFSPLFWISLATQFVGGVYMLMAAVASVRQPGPAGISLACLQTGWAESKLLATIKQHRPIDVFLRYGLALIGVALAAVLRAAVEAEIGPGLPPFLTFFPALVAVALLAGFGPGLLATVLSLGVVAGWILPSGGGQFAVSSFSPADRLGFVLFAGTGLFTSTISALYRHYREKSSAYDREAAVRETQARLAVFAEATFEGIVESEGGRIIDCNEQFAAMVGYSVAELRGTDIGQLIAPEDRDRVMAKIRAGQASCVEHGAIRRDGTRIIVEARGQSVGASKGRHTAVRDITARKAIEQELRMARDRLESHLANSPLAIIEFDRDYRITRWCGAAEQVFGWSASEVLGRAIQELSWVHGEDKDLVERNCDDMLTHRRTSITNVNRNYRKDGSLILCEWYSSAIYDAEGRLASVLSQVVDVTERKKADQALRLAQEELRHRAEELERTVEERTATLQETVSQLEQYSYSISHDMRAPLRAMNQYSEFLLQEFGQRLPEQGQKYLKRISSAAARMDRLIRDVLSYHRLARAEMKLEPVSLDVLIQDIVQQYPMVQASHAHIEIATPLGQVQGNVAALTQCLSNLLGNAVKFVSPGVAPVVKVWAEERGLIVRVWVEDNGIGMDPAHFDRIWGIFQQVHHGKSYEGTGIGLSIVKKAVEKMGGRVGVESTPEKGSRFWFELPAVQGEGRQLCFQETSSQPTPSSAARVDLPPANTCQCRILAIDDSENDLFFLCHAIERDPELRCVGTLSSGEEALKYFRRDHPYSDQQKYPPPNLVFLDLKMPGLDGFGVLSFLQESLPKRLFRVIVLTSSQAPVDQQRCRELGADAYETKPGNYHGYSQLLQRVKAFASLPVASDGARTSM